MAFCLTGFADEIDASLDVQLETLKRLDVTGLDLRSLNGFNVLDLGKETLFQLQASCREAGIRVQSIGSPVNKIKYDILAEGRELDRLDRAIKAANLLNVQRIRIFTPEIPEGSEEELGPKILNWMMENKIRAEQNGVILLVENDARYWSAYPDNAKRLFDTLGGPSFRAAFDFANTVLIGYRAMEDWFPWLLPHLDTLHIKDAVAESGQVVPAGKGDAQVEETLRWLVEQGWSGPLTLEPHLQAAGPLGGFSGPELFEVAVSSFREVLTKVGIGV